MIQGSEKLKVFRNLNRPVYFWGFSPIQLLVSVLIIGITAAIKIYVAVIIVIPVIIIMGKIKRENQKGNPDYLESLLIKRITPKYIEDHSKIFKSLIHDRP
jgi:hypothetical protein